jgi:hypothetical protein
LAGAVSMLKVYASMMRTASRVRRLAVDGGGGAGTRFRRVRRPSAE